MIVTDAINTLGVTKEEITEEDVKKAYLTAAKKYHPDVNPAGEQLMKLINDARDSLMQESFPLSINGDGQVFDYGEEINQALNKIIDFQGISIEICGAWVWISGDTKSHWPKFKEIGFFYAPKKKQVYYRPKGFKGRSRGKTFSMDEIRQKYGSQGIKTKRPYQLSC